MKNQKKRTFAYAIQHHVDESISTRSSRSVATVHHNGTRANSVAFVHLPVKKSSGKDKFVCLCVVSIEIRASIMTTSCVIY